MRLYLSGPMSGLPDDNAPAFEANAARIRALGHDVVSPAELPPLPPETSWADYMRRDIPLLSDVEGVVVLPGWGDSRGSVTEVWVASAVYGLPIFDAELASIAAPAGFLLSRLWTLLAPDDWRGLVEQEASRLAARNA